MCCSEKSTLFVSETYSIGRGKLSLFVSACAVWIQVGMWHASLAFPDPAAYALRGLALKNYYRL